MRWLAALVVAVLGAGGAVAQPLSSPTDTGPEAQAIASAVVTVDVERLFGQSQFGQRIGQTYTEGRAQLAVENGRIAEALRAEELDLAERRPDMDPDVFRTEAQAFDEKAQAIRRAQDAKGRALEELLTEGRDEFLEVSRPILGQLMVERGALVILEQRATVLSLGSIDITDEAITRINEAIGDGADLVPDN